MKLNITQKGLVQCTMYTKIINCLQPLFSPLDQYCKISRPSLSEWSLFFSYLVPFFCFSLPLMLFLILFHPLLIFSKSLHPIHFPDRLSSCTAGTWTLNSQIGPLTAEAKISNHHLYGKWVIMQSSHNENIMEKVYQHMLTPNKWHMWTMLIFFLKFMCSQISAFVVNIFVKTYASYNKQ